MGIEAVIFLVMMGICFVAGIISSIFCRHSYGFPFFSFTVAFGLSIYELVCSGLGVFLEMVLVYLIGCGIVIGFFKAREMIFGIPDIPPVALDSVGENSGKTNYEIVVGE